MKTADKTLKYLLAQEWSSGNGQCPECGGVPKSWFGHPLNLTPDTIGHEKACKLAAAIKGAGGKPMMLGEFRSRKEYEPSITKDGFFTTRLKTKKGCRRYALHAKSIRDSIEKSMMKIIFGIKLV